MDRREAIKLLSAMPMVKSVEVARVTVRDVIVIEADAMLTNHMAQHIKERMEQIWPNNKVIVFSQGLRMRIARADNV